MSMSQTTSSAFNWYTVDAVDPSRTKIAKTYSETRKLTRQGGHVDEKLHSAFLACVRRDHVGNWPNSAERLQQGSRKADELVNACSDVPKQAYLATFP